MTLFLILVGVIANFQERHILDLGLAFTEKTDDFILVTENSIPINFMQPILLQCDMKDKNYRFQNPNSSIEILKRYLLSQLMSKKIALDKITLS